MLRMKPVASGKQAEQYYARTDGGYYAESTGLRCQWGGKGATRLGLEGPPEFDQFNNLIHGLDPHTGEQLTAKLVKHRLSGWDVTASIPKNVTIALEEGDTRIQEAFWESIRESMARLESYATTRVRVDGKQEDRVTGNLVWYAVEHPDTRPVEDTSFPEGHRWRVMPQMDRHAHVFVANLTWDGEEEKWKAVKFRPIMDLRRFFDRDFESRFSAKLASLGYQVKTEWQRDAKGGTRYRTWDITGIPESVKERFSKRSAEIGALEEAIVEKRKEADPEAPDQLSVKERDQLGATSRRFKRDDLTLEECREYWASCITGDERDAIARTLREAREGGRKPPEVSPEEAVRFAFEHHAEQRSLIPFEDLAITAMEASLGSATPEAIDREIERQGIVGLHNGQRMVTTEALQAEEDEILRLAQPGRGVLPVGVPEALSRKLEGGSRLNDGQWEAVRGLLDSPNRVNLIEGPAGAGKSSLLAKYDEAMRMQGREVTYLATTAKATEVLQKDGFAAHTLARFLLDEKMQEASRGGHIVVDETSMLGHRDALKLLRLAHKLDLKITAVGDPFQHGAVARGAFHTLLKSRTLLRPFRLSEILRQKDGDYLEAAKLLSTGETLPGLEKLEAKGWVHEIGSDTERYGRMAAEYVDAVLKGESVLMVSPTHREAGKITEATRGLLRAAGKLGKEDHAYARLVPIATSEAERKLERTYEKGDVIQFHQNAKGGFKKGQRLLVTDPASVPRSEAARFTIYRPEPIALAEGDKIRFTATVKAKGKDAKTFRNGSVATIAGFAKDGDIRLSDGSTIGKDAGHFRHALVETSFGAQGQTVSKVILGMSAASSPAMNQEQLYVSATRGRKSLSLFTDDLDSVKDAVQRSSQKLVALDLRPQAKPEAEAERQAREQAIRRHLAHQRKRGLVARMRSAFEVAAKRARDVSIGGFAARETQRRQEHLTGYER
ncbi:MobF family relaxase [Tautonia marina]|uniref:MobF family relaxase n=1 Tax=Tautonia marina TaxID=2653855 RepID=UPI0012609771|nr:MobF family relaxase [Tautonia marina]